LCLVTLIKLKVGKEMKLYIMVKHLYLTSGYVFLSVGDDLLSIEATNTLYPLPPS
jgi:hypothetical protein